MTIKLIVTLACLALAAPVVATGALAADPAGAPATDASPATPSAADDSSKSKCKPACVAPDECCELSILDWACSLPADCFAKKQKLQKK
jgi:hypothetical protein